MARKRSEASVILEFFRNSPLDTAQVVFDLVREEIKRRRFSSGTKGPIAAASGRKAKAANLAAAVAEANSKPDGVQAG